MGGRLEYDSTAFGYFFLAAVLCFLIPGLALWLRPSVALLVGSSARPHPPLPECDTWGPAQRRIIVQRDVAHAVAHAQRVNQAKIKLAALAVAAMVAAFLLWMQSGVGKDIQQFDPFEILGISERASDTEIKKAYRKLSLQYHPDRWSAADKADKALAETRFLKVAKAYEALTDAVAKENYKLYGNPDGRQALEMSIGLPTWLLDSDNQIYVILSYLLIFVVIFPASLILFANRASNKTDNALAPDTEEMFRMAIRQVTPTASIIDAFANAAEFRTLGYRSAEERNAVSELRKTLIASSRMPPKPATHFFEMPKTEHGDKALVLTYVHMARFHDKLSDVLLQDLDFILRASPPLLRALVDHARTTCQVVTLRNAIGFQQHFNQAMLVGTSPFLQIPHLSAKQSANLAKRFDKSLERFLQQNGLDQVADALRDVERNEGEAAGADGNAAAAAPPLPAASPVPFSEAALADIKAVCDHIPVRRLAEVRAGATDDIVQAQSGRLVDAQVSWFAQTARGDVVNVLVSLTRVRASPYPYTKSRVAWTPFLPHEIKELWYIFITNGPQPTGMTNLPAGKDKVVSYVAVRFIGPLLCLSARRAGGGHDYAVFSA